MPHARKLRIKAVGLLFFATLLWALSFPLAKALWLVQHKSAPTTSSWGLSILSIAFRFTLAALTFVIFWFAKGRPRLAKREVEQGVLLAVAGGLGLLFQMDGLLFTKASISAFLTQCYCISIPLYLALRQRKAPGPLVTLCSLLVFCGVALLSGVRPGEFGWGRGEVETVLSSVFFAAQILLLEGQRYRENRPLWTSFVMFACLSLTASVATFSVFTPAQVGDLLSGAGAIPLLLLLSFVCTLVPFVLMNQWQPKISATEAGLIYCVEPVFACLLVLFLPQIFSNAFGIHYGNESFEPVFLWGGSLIVLSNIALQLQPYINWKRAPKND